MSTKDATEAVKLIKELIESLEDETISLSKALTKAQRIYIYSKNGELKKFLKRETEGAFDDNNMPDYRKVFGEPVGVFRNRYSGLVQHTALNYERLIEKAKLDSTILYRRHLAFSVKEMEDYLEKNETQELKVQFSPGQLEFVKPFLKDDERNGWFIIGGYFEFPYSTFSQILSITKSRFIEMLLKIENDLTSNSKQEEDFFFENGKHFDAIIKISEIVAKAKKEIILVDSYVDENTLKFFSSKKSHIQIKILTDVKSNNEKFRLLSEAFNTQYQNLLTKSSSAFHDRFLIIDESEYYHIGASIKDAGKKTFMLSLIKDESRQAQLYSKFQKEWNK